jgi:hypothetical protein
VSHTTFTWTMVYFCESHNLPFCFLFMKIVL